MGILVIFSTNILNGCGSIYGFIVCVYWCDRCYLSQLFFTVRYLSHSIGFCAHQCAQYYVTNERLHLFSFSQYFPSPSFFFSFLLFYCFYSLPPATLCYSATLFSFEIENNFSDFYKWYHFVEHRVREREREIVWSLFVCEKKKTNCMTSCCVSWTAHWIQRHRRVKFCFFFSFFFDLSLVTWWKQKKKNKHTHTYTKRCIFELQQESKEMNQRNRKKKIHDALEKLLCKENKVLCSSFCLLQKWETILASIRFHWMNISSVAPFKASPINSNFVPTYVTERSVSLHTVKKKREEKLKWLPTSFWMNLLSFW